MDKDKEIEKTEDKKLRDLTPEKDAKGGTSGTALYGPPVQTTEPSPGKPQWSQNKTGQKQ
jgi:hypothetical protein